MSDLVYSGGRPERNGWVFGLTLPQLGMCVAALAPSVVVFGAGRGAAGLVLLLPALVVVALVVVPVRGRPAVRWLADAARHGAGRVTGWSAWQSKVAAGLPVERDEPDLPGILSRLEFRDGPVMAEHGRVCVLHDTGEGRWAATARLSARGIGLASALEQHSLASGLGRMLLGLVDSERIDRASLLVRSVPDDGTAYDLWRARNQVDDAPPLVAATTRDLLNTAVSASAHQEAFLTVSARDEVLRKAANAAGGGAQGRAWTLYRGLAALAEPLQAMGCDLPAWLGSAELVEAIRTGFNPGAAALLAGRRLASGGADPGLPAVGAGPSRAPAPSARSYTHDGYTTVSYALIPSRLGVRFGSLAPLVAIRTAGERRNLAIHYEVLPQRMAQRIAARERQKSALLGDLKASKGFGRAARDAQDSGHARRTEDAVAAGQGMVRYAIVVSITVPSHWDVEDHAEALETAAAGQYQLQRLELAQDSGFVASALPVGIGLTRTRSVL